MMYAARKNPSMRKMHDINLSAIEKMIAHDEGGKLPEKVRKKKRRKQAMRKMHDINLSAIEKMIAHGDR